MEQKQIIMLGNTFVGKTNIVLQYTKREFKSEHIMTLGIDFSVKETKYGETNVQLQIFDTNGNDKHTSFLPRSYYRNANGILLVCCYDDKKSFSDLKGWIENIKENCDNFSNIVCLINKVDLDPKYHIISKEEIEDFCKEHNLPVVEVSAKNNIGIDYAFELLIEKMFSGSNNQGPDSRKETVYSGLHRKTSDNFKLKHSPTPRNSSKIISNDPDAAIKRTNSCSKC